MNKNNKSLLLLFVFLVSIVFYGCGAGRPPLPPPVPQPQPTYTVDDGKCDLAKGERRANSPKDCNWKERDGQCDKEKGENAENSKIDCKAQPDPDPEPEPEPEVVCEKGRYDAECSKITRDHSTARILGNYTGPLGQETFNWDEYFKLFPTDHPSINYQKTHNISPWDNRDNFTPWEYKNGRYTKNLNPKWWAQYEWMLYAAAYYDIGIVQVMIDQYCNPDCGFCRPDWYTMTEHPFQRVCTDSSNNGVKLYRNWLGRLPVCENAVMMCWDAGDEFNTDTYRATSTEGEMLMLYLQEAVKRTARIRDEVKKQGRTLRTQWVFANESYYYVTKENSCKGTESHGSLDPSKSRYLDDRYQIYFLDLLKKHGFRPNRDDNSYAVNEEFRYLNKHEDFCWTAKVFKYLKGVNQLYEIHGISDVRRVEQFTKAMDLDPDFLVLSSDGVDEDENYYKNMKAISKLKLKYFDYKLYENGPRFRDANDKAKYFVPRMDKAIFQ